MTSSWTTASARRARPSRATRRSGRRCRSRGRGSRTRIAPDGQRRHRRRPSSRAPSPWSVCRCSLAKSELLAVEGQPHQPHRVHAGEERSDQAAGPHAQRQRRPCSSSAAGQDLVLGQREEADQGDGADPHQPLGLGQGRAQAAHLAHVLLVGRDGVDDDARGQEQQRLERSVREQVEETCEGRANTDRGEHVAKLRHRRIGNALLEVGLEQRSHASPDGQGCHADDGDPQADLRRQSARSA